MADRSSALLITEMTSSRFCGLISQSVMDAVSPSAGQNLEGSLAAAKQTVLQAEKSGR